jgi:hypothetical protein
VDAATAESAAVQSLLTLARPLVVRAAHSERRELTGNMRAIWNDGGNPKFVNAAAYCGTNFGIVGPLATHESVAEFEVPNELAATNDRNLKFATRRVSLKLTRDDECPFSASS